MRTYGYEHACMLAQLFVGGHISSCLIRIDK